MRAGHPPLIVYFGSKFMVNNMPQVQILLATHNGEAYLAEQIESVVRQTYTNWTMLIHDDGSTDGTLKVARRFRDQYPSRIKLVEDGIVLASAKANFSHMMALSEAGYVMFCDQDDVWLEDKIEISMDVLVNKENEVGKDKPLAVFSDVRVVDEHLSLISDSIWRYQGTGPALASSLQRLAVRNCLTGCTMALNRAAINVASPVPDRAVMHDWWCGLKILQSGGVLLPICAPTVNYRQHGANAVGALKKESILKKILGGARVAGGSYRVYRMARTLGAFKTPFGFVWAKAKIFLR